MIKNSSEYIDVKELVDFVLEYGMDKTLLDMEGLGEKAFAAAVRLKNHGLPKATEKPEDLPAITVDIINHVSGLSNIVGHVTAIMGDARLMAWAGENDYWVWLEIDEDNKFKVLVNLNEAPSTDNKVLNLIGYCGFHDIPYQINHKEMRDEDA